MSLSLEEMEEGLQEALDLINVLKEESGQGFHYGWSCIDYDGDTRFCAVPLLMNCKNVKFGLTLGAINIDNSISSKEYGIGKRGYRSNKCKAFVLSYKEGYNGY